MKIFPLHPCRHRDINLIKYSSSVAARLLMAIMLFTVGHLQDNQTLKLLIAESATVMRSILRHAVAVFHNLLACE